MSWIAWQEVVSLALVVVAASYLARVVWRNLAGRQTGGCGTCDACPETETLERPLVQINRASHAAPLESESHHATGVGHDS